MNIVIITLFPSLEPLRINSSVNHPNPNPFSFLCVPVSKPRHGGLAQRLCCLCEGFPLILDAKAQWISIEFQAEKVEKQLECYLAANTVAPRLLCKGLC